MENQNIEWNYVKECIDNQKTLLFIGPGVTINYNDKDSFANFTEEIANQNQQAIKSFHKQDGFLVFNDPTAQMLISSKIRNYYKKDFTNELLLKISDIPFHLIIQVTPDLTMKNIFEKKNFQCLHKFYNIASPSDIADNFLPAKDYPLIYNLFGSVDDYKSFIVTHHDLFEFLKAIYSSDNNLKNLRSTIGKENIWNVIFLGFEFDKWYYQLILSLLNLDYQQCVRYASSQENLTVEIKTLVESHFRVNFINKDSKYFVDKIYEMFSKSELRKAAAKPEQQRKYIKKNIVKLLTKGLSAMAFENFCLCNFEEVYDQFTSGQSNSERIILMIDYAEKYEQFEQLLELVKEENHVQFANFLPYFE